jgi:hypothetical protein
LSIPDAAAGPFDINPDLSPHERASVLDMLSRHPAAFSAPQDGRAPIAHGVEHCIHLTDDVPVALKPYRMTSEKRALLDEHVAELLAKGIIEPSISPYAAPVVGAAKKLDRPAPGAGSQATERSDAQKRNDVKLAIRWCIDFRHLNMKTARDAQPIPRIDDCFYALKDAKCTG